MKEVIEIILEKEEIEKAIYNYLVERDYRINGSINWNTNRDGEMEQLTVKVDKIQPMCLSELEI